MQDQTVTLENQAVADLALRASEIQKIDGTPIAMLPASVKAVDLEQHLAAPTRKRGTIRANDVESFCHVIARHGVTETTEIYRTTTPPRFEAVFNAHALGGAGAPGWADFRAVYDCPLSVEWKEWTGADGRKMNQADFAQFIEDNLPDIVEPAAATMLEVSRTLEAKKKVNFASGIRLSNGQQEFTYEEQIQGTAQKGRLQVPEVFFLGISVFEGGPRYRVPARLRYRISDGGALTMWFDLERPHKIIEDAVTEIVNAVQTKTGITTINGTPSAAGA